MVEEEDEGAMEEGVRTDLTGSEEEFPGRQRTVRPAAAVVVDVKGVGRVVVVLLLLLLLLKKVVFGGEGKGGGEAGDC